MTGVLAIERLEIRGDVVSGSPEAAGLRSRLDRLARSGLTGELAGLLPSGLDDDEAVYRIRRLRLSLWLDGGTVTDGVLVRRWARLLAEATMTALDAGPDADVVRYVDTADFLSAFLDDLVAGRAWSRWMYAEFAPLRGLPTGVVVAQLLSARPALLGPVAARLEERGRLEALVRVLDADDVALIWRTGLGFEPAPPAVPLGSDVERAVGRSVGRIAWERGGPAARARTALRLYLATLRVDATLAGGPALGAACTHLALLYDLAAALTEAGVWSDVLSGTAGLAARARPVLDGHSGPGPGWLYAAAAFPAGRAHLARLAALLDAGRGAPPDASGAARTGELLIRTRYAGLALLLPTVRDTGLHERLGPAGRYELLLALLGRRHRRPAESDPAVAWWAGTRVGGPTEAELGWTDLADAEDAGPADEEYLGTTPAAAVAGAVFRRFAAGLRGFGSSSAGYLGAQFVHLPGRLSVTDDSVRVTLERAPLGVVLRMAGCSGDRGVLPWLAGRRLTIELPDG